MKLFLDFLPVVAFFVVYKLADIYVATAAAIAASLAVVAYTWWRERRVEKMALVTAGLMVVLGGATLWLHDDTFVLWKPTAVNWLFAVAFLGSTFVGERKPMVRRALGAQIELPDRQWRQLNLAWVTFFAVCGALNLVVAFHFDRDTWVNFKLFGLLGLTVLFVFAQGWWLMRHLPEGRDSVARKE